MFLFLTQCLLFFQPSGYRIFYLTRFSSLVIGQLVAGRLFGGSLGLCSFFFFLVGLVVLAGFFLI